jgi:hypothetical protein
MFVRPAKHGGQRKPRSKLARFPAIGTRLCVGPDHQNDIRRALFGTSDKFDSIFLPLTCGGPAPFGVSQES